MLYTFSQAQYDTAELNTWLAALNEGDAVVLWQDGVLQAVKNPQLFASLNHFPVFALEVDLNARALIAPPTIQPISLEEFIVLTEQFYPQIAL